jgi:hypothetical protein
VRNLNFATHAKETPFTISQESGFPGVYKKLGSTLIFGVVSDSSSEIASWDTRAFTRDDHQFPQNQS